jgi:hypothetical protein
MSSMPNDLPIVLMIKANNLPNTAPNESIGEIRPFASGMFSVRTTKKNLIGRYTIRLNAMLGWFHISLSSKLFMKME